MAPSKSPLGSAELEILRYISDHAPLSVGAVADHFAETSGQARTTIMTVMERLRKKGYLTRKPVKGVFHYSPKVPKQDLLLGLVKKFVATTLGGSVAPFVAYLSAEGEVSDEELQQLQALVRDLQQQRKDGDQ